MLIYLTRNVQFASKLESFDKRGLSGQVSAKAAEAGIAPLTTPTLSSLILYNSLHQELPARLSGKPAYYEERRGPSNILAKFGPPRFEWPQLIVEMKQGGEALHPFGMFETATSKMGLYAGQPTIEQLRNICTLGLDFYSTVPAGNVNLSGYLAFVMAWRGVHAFFAVGGGTSGAETMRIGIDESGGRSVQGRAATPATQKADGSLAKEGQPERKPGGVISMTSATFITGTSVSAAGIRVIDVSTPPEKIPGYVFPFFREMLDADADNTFTIFQNLFRLCYSGPDELSQTTPLYRRGFRYLSSTHAGKIVQHIYFCMDLSIKMGGRLHLLSDGSSYAGCVIEIGKGSGLLYKNRMLEAEEDIHGDIASLNTHAAAVEKIFTMLIALGRIDGDEERITIEQIRSSPRKLREMIISRMASDITDKRAALNDLISELKYSQQYWEVSPANIVKFLSLVNSGADMSDQPLYVHIDTLTNRSGILPYLAVFGGQAPSIFHGDSAKAIAPVTRDDPNLTIVNGKRAVPHIPFVMKGLVAASYDWASVARSKTFKFKAPRKGKGNITTGFSDTKGRDGVIANPHFDPFYTILRTWVHRDETERVVAIREKAKRKADDMQLEGSPPAKKSFTFF